MKAKSLLLYIYHCYYTLLSLLTWSNLYRSPRHHDDNGVGFLPINFLFFSPPIYQETSFTSEIELSTHTSYIYFVFIYFYIFSFYLFRFMDGSNRQKKWVVNKKTSLHTNDNSKKEKNISGCLSCVLEQV